jgi:glutaredoxin 3
MQFLSKIPSRQLVAVSKQGLSSTGRRTSLRHPEFHRPFSSAVLTRNNIHNTALTGNKTEKAATNLTQIVSSIKFMSTAASVTHEITSLIENNKVVIFSKSYCPFCSSTKRLFERMGMEDVVVVELDLDPSGHEMQAELQKLTGQGTVPNVFVNGKHIGGNSDTQAAYKNGVLQEMLK